jgi:phospholipid-binding lipoprotein MlaA
MLSTIRIPLAVLCLLLACGCATQAPAHADPRDPWESMNRATFRFNDKFDRAIAKPVARGYRKITPHLVQTGVTNFLSNLNEPVVMVNELLQGKFAPFMHDTSRLLVNSVIGVGGLFDPATPMGIDKNDSDFGQTLGVWGAGPGPYFVIPFLGPSDVRDAFGRGADVFADPRHYIRDPWTSYGLWTLGLIDTRAHLLDVEGVIQGAYDPYSFLRNAYLQNRQFKVRGGGSSGEEAEEKKLLEESGVEQTAPQAQPPAEAPPQQPTQPPPRPPQ